MATGPNAAFVRLMGTVGFAAATIGSGGTASNKLGQDLTCALSTNDYQISFSGFRTTGQIYLATRESTTLMRVTSKTTSTCTVNAYTCFATGGTATNADFDILVMGLGVM
jgi:hypothetical protein